MREEYNSVLSTPAEADNIGRFGRYRYIGEAQISAWLIYRSMSTLNDIYSVPQQVKVYRVDYQYEVNTI